MVDELTDEYPDEFRVWSVDPKEEYDEDESDEDEAYEVEGDPSNSLSDCSE